MITRALAGLVLATHLAAGLLPAGLPSPEATDLLPRRDAPRADDDGPAIRLDRRSETPQVTVLPRGHDRTASVLRRATLPAAEIPAPTRLTFCVELTKPAYLKLRLASTPQSYRSPPA